MTAVTWARVAAASLLVSAGSALADEPAAAAVAAARPAGSPGTAAPSRAGAADPASKKPPAVLVVPLLGIVFLPMTLPVTEPRVRRTAPPATSSTGAQP